MIVFDGCQGCGFNDFSDRASQLKEYGSGTGSKLRLCKLCAGSRLGLALLHPEDHPELNILQTICYVGNAILKATGQHEGAKPDQFGKFPNPYDLGEIARLRKKR